MHDVRDSSPRSSPAARHLLRLWYFALGLTTLLLALWVTVTALHGEWDDPARYFPLPLVFVPLALARGVVRRSRVACLLLAKLAIVHVALGITLPVGRTISGASLEWGDVAWSLIGVSASAVILWILIRPPVLRWIFRSDP